jgi:hypothetical protein
MIERYCIVRPLPSHLDYVTASDVLEIVKQKHDTIPLDEWVFRARRENVGTVCVIVSAMVHRSRLLEQLSGGFDVEARTPAAKLMERLGSARGGESTSKAKALEYCRHTMPYRHLCVRRFRYATQRRYNSVSRDVRF